MSIDNPNLYGAMVDAVAGSEDELALYGFTVGIETLRGTGEAPRPVIWIEWTDPTDGVPDSRNFENVPEFEAWASKTIDAHREVTA